MDIDLKQDLLYDVRRDGKLLNLPFFVFKKAYRSPTTDYRNINI